MIKIGKKKYPSEFVNSALEAYYKAGNNPDDYEDPCDDVGFAVETEKGTLSVYTSNDEFHSIYVDLLANDTQCAELHVSKDIPKIHGTRNLPLATIEVPDSSANVTQGEGMVENCPRIFLYERLDDYVSHSIFMDGTCISIRN